MLLIYELGLKYISKKAQEIVLKKKKTTFKEVADILISNLPFTQGNDVIFSIFF